MLSLILEPEIQQFINDNIEKDIARLALQKNPFPFVNWIEIINQIVSKNKSRYKLPTWFSTRNILYPNKISIEQTSSEKTAAYKASLISGDCLIDITGGFGIDDYYFSKNIKKVVHCEINKDLSDIVKHNYKQLEIKNIECLYGDGAQLLKNLQKHWSWIYIDPSRRDDNKEKVFMLKDCLPNVPELLNFYFKYTSHVLVKTAPLLDITSGIRELQNIKCIHIIAVNNEVKELLWELKKEYTGNCIIKTVNITKENIELFSANYNHTTKTSYSLPKKYLYEPNNSLMKSGAFDSIGFYYEIDKLHQHSHLYTTDKIIDFPGRIFEIQTIIPYHKKDIKKHIETQKANITTRNFPESVESIRKKWKIKEGGNLYYFFTTDLNDNKIVLICTKLK